jgi:signal transduction histidine kinase
VEVGELPTIEADPMQMRQLLLNLIGNALKFQPPGNQPVVRISGRTFVNGAGEVICELSVQDNGIGFDEKYLDKIFAVFQRLHGRGEYEGTGVGLAVCRRIVDRHHGNIVAHSKPGQGATFIVTVPARQPSEAPSA